MALEAKEGGKEQPKEREPATYRELIGAAYSAVLKDDLNSEKAAVAAVPVDSFDAILELDADFARRVLDLESRRLQRLTRA